MSHYKFSSERINVAAVVMVFAVVQIMTGVFMIVQYSRLTGFIDCQAAYNQSTSDVRKERLPASNRENEALFDAVRTTQQTGVGSPQARRAFARAVRAHERYLQVQRDNPYKSPSDTCGKADAP